MPLTRSRPPQTWTGRSRLVLTVVAAASVMPRAAEAHGFGQRYDLPLPLSFYLVGTAAAIVLSFVVVAVFARHTPAGQGYPTLELPTGRFGKVLGGVLRAASVALLCLAISAGVLGHQD